MSYFNMCLTPNPKYTTTIFKKGGNCVDPKWMPEWHPQSIKYIIFLQFVNNGSHQNLQTFRWPIMSYVQPRVEFIVNLTCSVTP